MIGTAATKKLSEQHEVVALKRHATLAPCWQPEKKVIDLGNNASFDVVIHLSGAGIADKRWTPRYKQEILDSRVNSTQTLVNALCNLETPPRLLMCASAIGYYGHRGDNWLDEESETGSDFVSEIARQWEASTEQAAKSGIRTVNMRFGLILSTQGGALKQMLTPFKLGLGGRVGNGEQYYSWIAIDDVIAAMEWIMKNEQLSGPINIVAPAPVSNAVFTKNLAAALHRPAVIPMPATMAKIAFGEMADELLLSSTRVKPGKLLNSGFQFKFPTLPQALAAVLQ